MRNPKEIYPVRNILFNFILCDMGIHIQGSASFSLIELFGENSTGIIFAILIQTIIATVYHLGHPNMEIVGAFGGSIIFGIIAFATQSILYTIFLHAFLGILNDAIIYLRYYRNKKRD